ncbi:MAG: hypothetical protein AVDCRST_MAG51-2085, partial [uncultured Ramlibacter sp.]
GQPNPIAPCRSRRAIRGRRCNGKGARPALWRAGPGQQGPRRRGRNRQPGAGAPGPLRRPDRPLRIGAAGEVGHDRGRRRRRRGRHRDGRAQPPQPLLLL